MKKLFLGAMMIALGFTVNAQGSFNVGVNAALPTGDVKDFFTFALGLEANYLFEVSDTFEVGPSLSYVNYFGEDGVDDFSFLPIAAAARFAAGDSFTLGADLGYAVGLSPDGNDGGFYYRPMVGYDISENFMLQATYSGISADGETFSSFGLGAVFGL